MATVEAAGDDLMLPVYQSLVAGPDFVSPRLLQSRTAAQSTGPQFLVYSEDRFKYHLQFLPLPTANDLHNQEQESISDFWLPLLHKPRKDVKAKEEKVNSSQKEKDSFTEALDGKIVPSSIEVLLILIMKRILKMTIAPRV